MSRVAARNRPVTRGMGDPPELPGAHGVEYGRQCADHDRPAAVAPHDAPGLYADPALAARGRGCGPHVAMPEGYKKRGSYSARDSTSFAFAIRREHCQVKQRLFAL